MTFYAQTEVSAHDYRAGIAHIDFGFEFFFSQSMSQNSVNSYLSCYCGHPAPIKIAWTEDNPGRRFVGCYNYKIKNCGYFHWVDDKITKKERIYDFYKRE